MNTEYNSDNEYKKEKRKNRFKNKKRDKKRWIEKDINPYKRINHRDYSNYNNDYEGDE